MNTPELLDHLRSLGVQIHADGDRLRLSAPRGAITPDVQANLSARKGEILTFLRQVQQPSAEAIPRADRSAPLSLSPGQERLWSLWKLAPESPLYNMYLALQIDGPLVVDLLVDAITALAARHESLRTTVRDGRLHIAPPDRWPIVQIDLRDATEPRDVARQYIDEAIRRPFNLSADRLLCVELLQVSVDSHVLVMVMHHLIADGWSWAILLDELSAAYNAARVGYVWEPQPLPVQPVDVGVWQRRWLAGEAAAAQRDYWQRQLADFVARPTLAPDRTGAADRRGMRCELLLAPDLTAAVRTFAQRSGTTLFTVALAAFAAVLASNGDDEIAICSPVAGRTRSETHGLIGYFNNLLILRLSIGGAGSFHELLRRVQRTTIDAYANQEIPFEQVIALPGVPPQLPLDVVFALQEQSGTRLALDGMHVTELPTHNGNAAFGCFVTIEDRGDTLVCFADHQSDRYDKGTIDALLGALRDTLMRVVAAPDASLADVALRWRSAPPQAPQGSATPSYTAPRTSVEKQLVTIWERYLLAERIGVSDSFFDLGGTSLLALQMITRIEEELGVNLPLAALLHDPTIAHFADLIESGRHLEPWSPLVAVQPYGTQTPFFGVHGVHGNILFWRDIAHLLGPDQPFYGLQSWGVDGRTEALRSIPDMARRYIIEIQRVQSRGPYLIGGYSLGGEIAFEMAQQLTQAGEEVALLLLIDTMNPDRPVRAVQTQSNTTGSNGATTVGDTAPARLAVIWHKIFGHIRRISGKAPADMVRYLFDDIRMRARRRFRSREIAQYRRANRRLPEQLLLQHLEDAHTAALLAYAPQPYAGRITLFRSKESLILNPHDSPMGWGPLAAGGIEMHLFDAPHHMVDAAYIDELVEHFNAVLAAASVKNRV